MSSPPCCAGEANLNIDEQYRGPLVCYTMRYHSCGKADPVPEARRPRCQTLHILHINETIWTNRIGLPSSDPGFFIYLFIYILVTHNICHGCIVILSHLTLIVGGGWTRGLSDTLNPISALHTTSSSPSHHHLPPVSSPRSSPSGIAQLRINISSSLYRYGNCCAC